MSIADNFLNFIQTSAFIDLKPDDLNMWEEYTVVMEFCDNLQAVQDTLNYSQSNITVDLEGNALFVKFKDNSAIILITSKDKRPIGTFRFDADAMQDEGFVNHVVKISPYMQRIDEIAQKIMENIDD